MSQKPELFVVATGERRFLSGFGRPFGIGHAPDGSILIADMDLHGIVRLSDDFQAYEWLDGETRWTPRKQIREGRSSRAPARTPQAFNGPHSVACHPDGRMFVTTYYTPGLFALDPSGQMIRDIAAVGLTLKGPATATLAGDGTLLLTEYALHGIFKVTTEGEFLGALGGGRKGFQQVTSFQAGTGPAAFDRPHMAVTDADGNIIVADTWNHRLQKFSPDGSYLEMLGGVLEGWHSGLKPTPAGASATGLNAPVAVSVLGSGGLIVTDWGNDRLKRMDARGITRKVMHDLGLKKPYDAQVVGRHCVIANSHCGEVIVQAEAA